MSEQKEDKDLNAFQDYLLNGEIDRAKVYLTLNGKNWQLFDQRKASYPTITKHGGSSVRQRLSGKIPDVTRILQGFPNHLTGCKAIKNPLSGNSGKHAKVAKVIKYYLGP